MGIESCDVYVQMVLTNIGFYTMFYQMVRIKKRFSYLYLPSCLAFILLDLWLIYIFNHADGGEVETALLMKQIAAVFSFLVYFALFEGGVWRIATAIVISDLAGGLPFMLPVVSDPVRTERLRLLVFSDIPYIPYGAAVSILLFCMEFAFLRKYLRMFSEKEIENRLWVRAIALFYILNIIFQVAQPVAVQIRMGESVFISYGLIALLILASGVLFYRDHKLRQIQKGYYLQWQVQLMKDHYESLREQIRLTEQFEKDIRGYMKYMSGRFFPGDGKMTVKMLSEAAAETLETAETTGEMPAESSPLRTESRIVNYVLEDKLENCREQGINVSVQAEGVSLCGMGEMDLVVLLYNMLDNAAESCMKLADSGERAITLLMENRENALHIMCRNSRTGASAPAKGKKTWKPNRAGIHGTGMDIMKDIVKKYQGSFDVRELEEEFLLDITIGSGPENGRQGGRAE